MKTVELSAVFQPKQWAEKASREDNRKQDLTRTCALEHCSRCPHVILNSKIDDGPTKNSKLSEATHTRSNDPFPP